MLVRGLAINCISAVHYVAAYGYKALCQVVFAVGLHLNSASGSANNTVSPNLAFVGLQKHTRGSY